MEIITADRDDNQEIDETISVSAAFRV